IAGDGDAGIAGEPTTPLADSSQSNNWVPAGMMDLRPLKVHAAKAYPADHPFRLAVLQEPDFLPQDVGAAKLETYLRLIMALRDR
ncbi:MAG: hypothetical protein ACYC2H_11895, partial [Thermoplasmatota archaeon]